MHALWKVYCSGCICTVTPLPALKANATLFLHFDWMVSIYGRKIAAASGANGSQLLVPGLAGSQKFPSPDARHGWLYNRCLAAVNVNLLAQLSQTDRGSTDVLNTVHFEQKLQLSEQLCSLETAMAAIFQGKQED